MSKASESPRARGPSDAGVTWKRYARLFDRSDVNAASAPPKHPSLTRRLDTRARPRPSLTTQSLAFAGLSGEADAGTRTPDPIITSDVLYQLSYVGGENQSSPAQDSIVTSVPTGVKGQTSAAAASGSSTQPRLCGVPNDARGNACSASPPWK
jgi:hypothetical protein